MSHPRFVRPVGLLRRYANNDIIRPMRRVNGNPQQNRELFAFFGARHDVSRHQIPTTDDLKRAIDQGDLGRVRYMFYMTHHRLDDSIENYNLLKYALEKDQVGFFYILLEQGAPVLGYEKHGKSTFLHYAAEKNDIKLAKTLLGCNVNMLAVNEFSETALHVALKRGNKKVLYFLISNLSKPEQTSTILDHEGLSLFHILCIAPKSDYAKEFLQYHATIPFDINETISVDSSFCPGYNALHLASSYYRLDTVKLLIENRANINSITPTGLTALHLACLLKNIRSTVKESAYNDEHDSTHFSDYLNGFENILKLRFELIELFLNFDCNIDSRDEDGNNALMFLVQFNPNTNLKKNSTNENLEPNENPLVEALREENLRFRDMERRDNLGFGNLRHRRLPIPFNSESFFDKLLNSDELKYLLENEQLSIMKLLIKQYNNHLVDLNLDLAMFWMNDQPLEGLDYYDNMGRTCLHHLASILMTPTSLLILLLKCGANMNAADQDGRTPLHIAAENGNKTFIEVLLKYNNTSNWNKALDVNAEDNLGNTALRLVKLPIVRNDSFLNQNECFCLLLNAGADIYEEQQDDANEFSSEVRGHILQMIASKDFNKMMTLYNEKNIFDEEKHQSYLCNIAKSHVHIEMIESIVKYLQMLKAYNCYNIKLHYNFFDKVTKKLYTTPEIKEESIRFESLCEHEVTKMKKIKIDENECLYDIMKKKSDDIVPYTMSNTLGDILKSLEFNENFKIYKTLIKARYINALNKSSQSRKS